MRTSIQKGKEGEEFVNDLAFKSFFKYWCYPNPLDENGDKKEICDLLVLFKEVCIIISVKNYKNDGSVSRYLNKTIKKSIKQISGAERKLFNYPREIYIKHPNRPKEKFRKNAYSKIFRVIVNVGDIIDLQVLEAKPKLDNFITVFNREIFESVMAYLDTITDFVDYLTAREILLEKFGQSLIFGTEKDLLALYLKNHRNFPVEMLEAEANVVILDMENKWDEFEVEFKDKVLNKKSEELASRILDKYLEENLLEVENGPEIVREYLTLNRFYRRMFANKLLEFIDLHKKRGGSATGHRNFSIDKFGISFFYHGPEVSHENFIQVALQSIMVKYSQIRKHSDEHLLGLSINNEGGVSKIMYFPSNKITPEIENFTNKTVNDLGWFRKVKEWSSSIEEYPKK